MSKEEKYALMLVESDVELSKELAEGDILMEEYIEEAMEVSRDEFFGESYDKEWAREDQGRRDGYEEVAINMLRRGINIELISECTGIDVEELEYQKEKIGVNYGESYDKEWALEDQGRRDGYEQVLEQVKTTKSKEIAVALLHKGIDKQIISECTGMSLNEIEELK